MKVMKTMLPSVEGNIKMARGIQATPGMGRKISSEGRSASSMRFERPMATPSAMPTRLAAPKPMNTRRRLFFTW